MRTSFWRRFGLVLTGILIAVAVFCGLVGWTAVPEVGLGLIYGGVVAAFLGTLLAPSGHPTMGSQRPGGLVPCQEDLVLRTEGEEMRRSAKRPGGLLFAWLAAGALAILVGVLLRVL